MQDTSRRDLISRTVSVLDLPEVKGEIARTFKDRKWRTIFANSKLALVTDKDEGSSFLTSLFSFSVKYCTVCQTPWGTLDVSKARSRRDAEKKIEEVIRSWSRIIPEHIEALENMGSGSTIFESVAFSHLEQTVAKQKSFEQGIEELANTVSQYNDYAAIIGSSIGVESFINDLMKLPSPPLPKLSKTAASMLKEHMPSEEAAASFQQTQLQGLVKRQTFDHADLSLFISKVDTILRELIGYSESTIPKMGVNPDIIYSILDYLWKVKADVSTWRDAMFSAGREYKLSPVFWQTTRNWVLSKVGRQLRRLLRDSFDGAAWVIVGSEEIDDPRYHAGAQMKLLGHELPGDRVVEESDENTFPTLTVDDGRGFWRFLPDKLSHGDVELSYSEIGYETGEVRLSIEEFDASPSSVAVGTIWKIAEVTHNNGRRRVDKVQVPVYSYYKCIIRQNENQEILLHLLFESLEQCQNFVNYLEKMLAETFSVPDFDSVTALPRRQKLHGKSAREPHVPPSARDEASTPMAGEASDHGQLELLLKLPADVNAVRFAPQGDMLVIATADNALCAYEMETGRVRYTLKGYPALGFSVAISPDGRYIASGSWDNSVKFLDLETGRHVRSLEGHTNYVSAVAFSSDGDLLASGSWDGTIKIWKLPSGRLLTTIKAHEDWVKQVIVSHRTGRVITASRDRTVRIWSLGSGKLMKSINTGSNYTSTLALSSSEKILASGSMDRIIKIWDLKSGEMLDELKGHSGGITALTFGPDSNVIVSSSLDQSVRVWDIEKQETVESLDASHGAALSLAVSNGEKGVAVGYRNGNVGVWRECPLGIPDSMVEKDEEKPESKEAASVVKEPDESHEPEPIEELWERISALPDNSRELLFRVLKHERAEDISLSEIDATRLEIIRVAPKLSFKGHPLIELLDSADNTIAWGRHLDSETAESLQSMVPATYRGVDES